MQTDKLFNEDVMQLDTYIMVKLKEKTAGLKDELTSKNRSPISLSMGAPTFDPPKVLIEKLKEYLTDENIHTYSVTRGEKYFRDAVKYRMKERFGVELDPDNEICSVLGSKDGLANLIRFIINPRYEDKEKDIILIPDPGYASYSQMIRCSGGKAYSVCLTPKNNYMPDMESVLEKLKNEGYDEGKIKALIINYPNNPLGINATREYVKSVIEFCKKHDILLISDAAYCDLYYSQEDKPFSVFEFEGAKDIAVELFTLSKPYAITGWRLGWICGNSEVVTRFAKGKSTIDNGIFKAMQKACAYIMTHVQGDEYIDWANRAYKQKQNILINGLKELGWDVSNVPQTTFYLWLPIPRKYGSSVDFCNDLLEKSGIVVVPGTAFGSMGEGYFRISYVCSDDELKEVIKRMKIDGFNY